MYAWEYDRPRREAEEFVAEVAKLGGEAHVSETTIYYCAFRGIAISDADRAYLASLPGADQVTSIYLERTKVTGTSLRTLRHFPNLGIVTLIGNELPEDSLFYLAEVPKLKNITIWWYEHTKHHVARRTIDELKKMRPECRVESSYDHPPWNDPHFGPVESEQYDDLSQEGKEAPAAEAPRLQSLESRQMLDGDWGDTSDNGYAGEDPNGPEKDILWDILNNASPTYNALLSYSP